MLQDAKNRRQAVHSNLQTKSDMLREIQAEANAYLEDAFVCARLLELDDDEPDTPIGPMDIQQEYQEFRQALQTTQGETPDEEAAPLETGMQHLEAVPLTPAQQAVADLKNAYWTAEQRLDEAQVAFDRREHDRAEEWQANYDAVERGEEAADSSPEEFDLRWLKRNQELTHEVVEAETALAEAKATALAAGIEVGAEDQTSGFVDNLEDGYRVSFEHDQIVSVPEPKVSKWLSNIPDQASPTSPDMVEVDEWDTQTVGISDSVSLVAEGPDRRRIEKWRRICGL
ncbi:hypothetical protein LTR85_000596 [Meristemomyces frigidus]|nr:hypothetical protein LTR85_000596 [Meristemomyces frigidus]